MENQRPDRLQHHGEGGELFVIFIVNIILKIVTLGIYHFWAKTRVRRYLWTHTSFDGERFEYTGKGSELFVGYLVAMVAFIGVYIIAAIIIAGLAAIDPTLAVVGAVLIYFSVFLLIPIGLFMARRYLLSRTRFRSIRFALAGSPFQFMLRFVGYGVLNLLCVGLLTPVMRNALYTYEMNNTWFGNETFCYEGKGGDLFGKFVIAYLLMLPTLGLIWFWYLAAEMRYRAERTTLQGMRFEAELTAGQLIWLVISNFLLIVVTLGLAFPWVLIRNTRFAVTRLHPHGELDYQAIAQSKAEVPGMGEGLVEAFDMGGV